MQIFAVILLGLSSLLIETHGATINTRIVNGNKALAGQFPWQAAVYVDLVNGKFFCGGSLIHRQWILTAAHCVYNSRQNTIHLGSLTLQGGDPNRIVVASSTSICHPNFNTDTLENDIALIKLHLPVTFTEYVQPIPLASVGDIQEGSLAMATGWGQVADDVAGTVNDLQYVNMAVISNTECQMTYGSQVKSSMICTLGNYNEGICTGDTGGPLVAEVGVREYVQIGVSSFFSQQGCEQLHPSGYTRTDFYIDWINNITQTVQ